MQSIMHFAKLFIYIPNFRNLRCIPGLLIAISLSWMNYFGPLVQPVQGRDLDTGEVWAITTNTGRRCSRPGTPS